MTTPAATTERVSSTSARRTAFVLAILLALTAAVYARTLEGPFTFDDRRAITENPEIKDIGGFLSLRLFDTLSAGGRPLTDLTFAANYVLARLDPWSYHLANIAIHLAVTVLIFAFTMQVARLAGSARPRGFALAIAGIHALHPIQTETVGYVVQRAESLASGFYISVLILLLSAERHGRTWRGVTAWLCAFAAYAAGLASKAIVLTAPAAHLVLAAAVTGTPIARRELTSWRRRLAVVAPFLALGAMYAVRTLTALKEHDAGFSVPGLPPATYLVTQLRVVPVYVRLLFWPAGQNVDWDLPIMRGLGGAAIFGGAAVLVALAAAGGALAAWSRGRFDAGGEAARLAALGVTWFVLVLSVTSSVVPLADVLVEHRVYLASWGIFVAAAALAERVAAPLGTRGGRAAVVAVVALWVTLATATYRRNAVWESTEALWRDALAKSPGKARIYLSLGHTLREQRRFEEAITVYSAGLEHARADAGIEAQLLNNIGSAYAQSGHVEFGVAVFRRAIEKAPNDSRLLGNLAMGLLDLGDLDGAVEFAHRAVAADPDNALAWNSIAAARLEQGDPLGALTPALRALEIDPDLGIARFNYGRALAGAGQREGACTAWREAVALQLPNAAREEADRLLAIQCTLR